MDRAKIKMNMISSKTKIAVMVRVVFRRKPFAGVDELLLAADGVCVLVLVLLFVGGECCSNGAGGWATRCLGEFVCAGVCGKFWEAGKAGGDGKGRGIASGDTDVPATGARVETFICGTIIIVCSVEMSCPGALFCAEGLMFGSAGGRAVGFAFGMFARE